MNEIRAIADPGLTMTARLYHGATPVGALITLTETAQPGWYTGNVPAGTPAGVYDVVLLDGSTSLDGATIYWDGAAEITPPVPPTDTGLCRVFGFLESIDNDVRLPTARIEFRLIAPDGTRAVASERLIAERIRTVKVDASGQIVGPNNTPYIDLQRNDMLTPAGTSYEVTSAALGLMRKTITLTTDTADLRTLLLA